MEMWQRICQSVTRSVGCFLVIILASMDTERNSGERDSLSRVLMVFRCEPLPETSFFAGTKNYGQTCPACSSLDLNDWLNKQLLCPVIHTKNQAVSVLLKFFLIIAIPILLFIFSEKLIQSRGSSAEVFVPQQADQKWICATTG